MEIGQKVQGYVIERGLGAGGMGAVYEARHAALGRRVAIKVLHPHVAADERLAFRFINEARASSIVGHPGVVDVHECGRLPDGGVYIVMELLAGESLGARVRREGRLALRDALAVVHQAAEVLAAAHAKGVVHRDVKPDNMMLVPDPGAPGGERVKLLDFGIAKVAQEYIQTTARDLLTQAAELLGTPRYMAPEQCRSAQHVDGKADVYALGVVLFRMIAGDTPFRGGTMGELMTQHVHEPPPSLLHAAPGTPAEVAALVERMLVKYPLLRPSAAEVAGETARLLGLAPRAPRIEPTVVMPSAQPAARRLPDEVTATVALPPSGTPLGAAVVQACEVFVETYRRHPKLGKLVVAGAVFAAMHLVSAGLMASALFAGVP